MKSTRLAFIDWLKAAGMALIVYGHVADYTVQRFTRPIYPKQLGVVFFLFVLGHSIARERRATLEAAFERLFEIYVLGLSSVTALALLGVAWRGTPNASNFEPFAFGVNVVVNAFPANPTLWYIGTYVHFVVLGLVVLRYVRVRVWTVGLVALFEILVRALLMNRAGDFVAYQVLPNWLTVFVLGVMCGQRPTQQALKPNAARILASVAPLAAMPFLCFIATATVPFHLHFPFMRLDVGGLWPTLLITSAAVTALYAGYALLAFRAALVLPNWAIVRFFSRNTLLVFIWHMPLLYVLPRWLPRHLAPWEAIAIQFVVLWIGLSMVSEVTLRLARPKDLRRWVGTRLRLRRTELRTESAL